MTAVAFLLLVLRRMLVLDARPGCRRSRLLRCAFPARRGRVVRCSERHLGAVTQPIGAVDDDAFARLEPGEDSDMLAIGRPDFHFLYGDGPVRFHHIDKGPRRAALYRRVGDEDCVVQRVDDKLDVYKLIGKQGSVFIVEERP